MDITIEPNDVFLTAADETYIRNRMYFALAASQPDIDAAQVSLCSIPGFEPWNLYHCRVEIPLPDGGCAVGDSSEYDIYVAIDRAVDRSSSGITSHGQRRRRAFSQSGSQLPSAA